MAPRVLRRAPRKRRVGEKHALVEPLGSMTGSRASGHPTADKSVGETPLTASLSHSDGSGLDVAPGAKAEFALRRVSVYVTYWNNGSLERF
jgi:hypothetical protein